MSWNNFLRKIAERYDLSREQRDVFVARFDEYNCNKTESELSQNLKDSLRLNIEQDAYKKEMREVYDKLIQSKENPDGCPDIDYKGPNKHKRLLAWLEAKYEEGSSSSESQPLPKLKYPNVPEPVNSPFYLERPPIESNCYTEVVKPGALIRIKAPIQMGKTSLALRILAQAAERGYRTVRLNLWEDAKQTDFESSGKFLYWLCANISRQLHLKPILDNYWNEETDAKSSCVGYLNAYLLEQVDSPVVLALDEIDRLFDYREIAEDFLYLLREWHENTNNLEVWKKLRLVLAYSTEPYIRLDRDRSPFNVGLPVKLPEFTAKQVQTLALLHKLPWKTSKEVKQLMEMVGGHPFLVRLALYHLKSQKIDLDRLLSEAASRSGIYSDHLRGMLQYLDARPELRAAMRKVLTTDKAVQLDLTRASKLEAMGLIKIQGNKISPSCQLYLQHFRDRL